MTAPNFGTPNNAPAAPAAPQAQAPAPQAAPQAQAPAPQADQGQAPAPQAGQSQNPLAAQAQGQAPAPQADQGASFAPANGEQPSAFTPVAAGGFAAEVPNVSRFIRLGDHVGKHVIMRVKGFGSRTFNQSEGAKETVECDIAVFGVDANGNLAEPDVYSDQGLTNGKIIAAARALTNQGNTVTAGVLAYGERKGGNNAPIILQSIETNTESGQQMLNYLVKYAEYFGWIPGSNS